jgi:hypothetical protein
MKYPATIGSVGQRVSNYRPGGATTNVARAPAIDRDKPVVVTAAPARPVISAYSPMRPDIQRDDLQAPALAPATSMRGLY